MELRQPIVPLTMYRSILGRAGAYRGNRVIEIKGTITGLPFDPLDGHKRRNLMRQALDFGADRETAIKVYISKVGETTAAFDGTQAVKSEEDYLNATFVEVEDGEGDTHTCLHLIMVGDDDEDDDEDDDDDDTVNDTVNDTVDDDDDDDDVETIPMGTDPIHLSGAGSDEVNGEYEWSTNLNWLKVKDDDDDDDDDSEETNPIEILHSQGLGKWIIRFWDGGATEITYYTSTKGDGTNIPTTGWVADEGEEPAPTISTEP